MKHVLAFLGFWWDFVVGDVWRVAASIVATLAIAAVVAGSGVNAWWLMPVAVVLTLLGSLRRAATRKRRRTPLPHPAPELGFAGLSDADAVAPREL